MDLNYFKVILEVICIVKKYVIGVEVNFFFLK